MESETNIEVKAELEDPEVDWGLIDNEIEIVTDIKVEPESADEEYPEMEPMEGNVIGSIADAPSTEHQFGKPGPCEIEIKVEPESSDAESIRNDAALPVSGAVTTTEYPPQQLDHNAVEIKVEPYVLTDKSPKSEIPDPHGRLGSMVEQHRIQSVRREIVVKVESDKVDIKVKSDPSVEEQCQTKSDKNGTDSSVSDSPTVQQRSNRSASKKNRLKAGFESFSDGSSKAGSKGNNMVSISDAGLSAQKTSIKVESDPLSDGASETVPKRNDAASSAPTAMEQPSIHPRQIKTEVKVESDLVSEEPPSAEANAPDAAVNASERGVTQRVVSQQTTEEEAVAKAKERIRKLANVAYRSEIQEGTPIPADPYAEFKNAPRHPNCKHSLDQLKNMAERIPAGLGVRHRMRFVRESYRNGWDPNTWDWKLYDRMRPDPPTPHPKCKVTYDELKCMAKSAGVKGEKRGSFMIHVYHRGKDPYKFLEFLSQDDSPPWCGYVRGKHTWSNKYAMLGKGFPHMNCKYTLKELKTMAEQIPESFGIETRMKFIHRCYVHGKDPAVEDWTQYNINPYYEFEDLAPHKNCTRSLNELKRISQKIPESYGSATRAHFVYRCFKLGKNPDTENWMRYEINTSKKLIINNPFKSNALETDVKLSEFEGMPRHHKCKYSLEKIEDLAAQIPESVGAETRVHFIRRCYRYGHDPMKEEWAKYFQPTLLRPPVNKDDPYAEFDTTFPSQRCVHSLEEIKRMAEQIPESFGIETRVKFVRRCYKAGKDPATEDWTQYNVDPYFEIKERPVHPRNRFSFGVLKKLAERIPESLGIETRVRFVRRCYQQGKNPYQEDWTKYKINQHVQPLDQKTRKTGSRSRPPPINPENRFWEFEGMSPHPKCKQSLEEIKQMAEQIPESLGIETRVHFVRRCYRFGHDPGAEDWSLYSKPIYLHPPINADNPYAEFDAKHLNRKHSLEEIKRKAERIPESFGIETRVNFVRRCYWYGKDPDTEDWTQYNINPYYEIEERPPHHRCRYSLQKLKSMAQRIPESFGAQAQVHFVRRCYIRGMNPDTEDWALYPMVRNMLASGSSSTLGENSDCSGYKATKQDEAHLNVSHPPARDKGDLQAGPKDTDLHEGNRSLEQLKSIAEQIGTRIKLISNLSKFKKITEGLAENTNPAGDFSRSPPGSAETPAHHPPTHNIHLNTEYPHSGPEGNNPLQGNHSLEELKSMALHIAAQVSKLSALRSVADDAPQNNFSRADDLPTLAGASEHTEDSDHPTCKIMLVSGSLGNAHSNNTQVPNPRHEGANPRIPQQPAKPSTAGPSVDSHAKTINPHAGFNKRIVPPKKPPSQSTGAKHINSDSLLPVGGFSKFIRKFNRNPGCKLSVGALESMALSLPTHKVMKRFMLMTYVQGKDPHQTLESLKWNRYPNSDPSKTGSRQEMNTSFNGGSNNNMTSSCLAAKSTSNSLSRSAGGLNNRPYLPPGGQPSTLLSVPPPIAGVPRIPLPYLSIFGQTSLSVPSGFPNSCSPRTVGSFHRNPHSIASHAGQSLLPVPPLVGRMPSNNPVPGTLSPAQQTVVPTPPAVSSQHLPPRTVGTFPRNPHSIASHAGQSLLPVPPHVGRMPSNVPFSGSPLPDPSVGSAGQPLNFLYIPPPGPWNSTSTTPSTSFPSPISIPAAGPPFAPPQPLPCPTEMENSSDNKTANNSNYDNQTDSYKLAGTQPKPVQDPTPVSLKRKAAYQEAVAPKKPLTTEATRKIENHGSKDAIVTLFIVPSGYPDVRLSEEQMDVVENGILEAILDIDDGSAKPTFQESFRSNGQYGFVCEDDFTTKWLCMFLKTYQPWPNASLRIISNESSKVCANAILPRCKDDDDKILKFIGKQNGGLNVSKWEVVERWDTSDSKTCMNLMVDEGSAKVLESCSRISFKLGSGKIVITRKEMNCDETGNSSGPEEVKPLRAFGTSGNGMSIEHPDETKVSSRDSCGVGLKSGQRCPSGESRSQKPVQSSQSLLEDHRQSEVAGGTRYSPVYRSSSSDSTSSEDCRSRKHARSSKRSSSSKSPPSAPLGRSKHSGCRKRSSKVEKSRRQPSARSMYDEDMHVRRSRSSSSGRASIRQDADRVKLSPSSHARQRTARPPSPDMFSHSSSELTISLQDIARTKHYDLLGSGSSGRASSKQNRDRSLRNAQTSPCSQTMQRFSPASSPDTVDLSEGEVTPSPPPSRQRSRSNRPVQENLSPTKAQALQDAATERFRKLIAAGFSRDKALEFTRAYCRRQLNVQPPVNLDLQSNSSDTDPTESLPTPKQTALKNSILKCGSAEVCPSSDDAEMTLSALKWFNEK